MTTTQLIDANLTQEEKDAPDVCWRDGRVLNKGEWFVDIILVKGELDEHRDRVLHRICCDCAKRYFQVTDELLECYEY